MKQVVKTVLVGIGICAIGITLADFVSLGVGIGVTACLGAAAGRSGWWP